MFPRFIINAVTLLLCTAGLTDVRADLTNCVPLASGLVSWWPAEGDATDIVSTNTGVLKNGATFGSGLVGQAFDFNGTTAFAEIADAPELRFTNAMTAETWFYARVVGSRHREIISKWGGGGFPHSYTLSIQPSGLMGCGISRDGGPINIATVLTDITVPANQWVHTAMVYDGNYVMIYLNGALHGITPSTNGIFPGNAPLIIGYALGTGSYFDGLIDEPSLYNRALTSEEIQSIYAAGPSGKCSDRPPTILTQPQGQVGYWGGNASFNVRATTNAPPIDYQWYVNGFVIPWAKSPTLTLTNLALSDGGNFHAVITNSVGSVTSNPALLIVNPAGVSLAFTPTLTITGTVGKSFGVQYSSSVSETNSWTTLTNFTLTQPVQRWFDTNVDFSSGAFPRRFYRVIAIP